MILSYAIDILPSPPIQLLRFNVPETRIQLDDSSTLLAMCSDGSLLAIRYMGCRELLSYIRQNRLMDIVVRLRARSQWAYLIIAGEMTSTRGGTLMIGDGETKWAWNAIQGALLSVQEAGVCVMHVRQEADLQNAVEMLAKRDRSAMRVQPKRDALFVSPAEDLLLALPDIGEERCEALLRHTDGSGAWALVALTDPETKIDGIGPETKAKARQALGLADDMTFTIVVKESSSDAHRDNTSDTSSNQHAAAA